MAQVQPRVHRAVNTAAVGEPSTQQATQHQVHLQEDNRIDTERQKKHIDSLVSTTMLSESWVFRSVAIGSYLLVLALLVTPYVVLLVMVAKDSIYSPHLDVYGNSQNQANFGAASMLLVSWTLLLCCCFDAAGELDTAALLLRCCW